jgi:hypothetical protein
MRRLVADNPAHRWIMTQPLTVVDIVVAGKTGQTPTAATFRASAPPSCAKPLAKLAPWQ